MTQEEKEQILKKFKEEVLPATARPCMKLKLDVEAKPGLTDSKAGGLGYVPHDGAIPTDKEGVQLQLLAQISCKEITIPNFPHIGLLQFWIRNDDLCGLDFEDPVNQDGFRVIYYAEVDSTVTEEEVAAKVQLPEDDDEFYFPVEGCFGLQFTETINYIDIGMEQFDQLLIQLIAEADPELGADLKAGTVDLDTLIDFEARLNLSDNMGHKIGGYPGFTQFDPRDNATYAPYNVLLFQLDSDWVNHKECICWGDAGICNFFISEQKLQQLDFSDILYNWDCC